MVQKSLAASLALVFLAFVCARYSKGIQDKYRREADILSDKDSKELEAREERWRIYTHVATLFCLFPLPMILLFPFTELTTFLSKTFGAAVLSGAIIALVKLYAKVKIGKLLKNDIKWTNQLALSALGLGAGTIVAAFLTILAEPTLKDELIKALFK